MAAHNAPLSSVVLYKNNVAYFERTTQVEGNAIIRFPFLAADHGKMLKSLLVRDLSGGAIGSVSYEGKQEFRTQGEASYVTSYASFADFLASLRGARVKITTKEKETIVGSILCASSTHLQVFEDAGGIRSFLLEKEILSIHFEDKTLQRDLQHFLLRSMEDKKRNVRQITIECKGQGKRKIVAAHLAEAAGWRTSYRLLIHTPDSKEDIKDFVLDAGGNGFELIALALVSNNSNEDWVDVHLDLVSGAIIVRDDEQDFAAAEAAAMVAAAQIPSSIAAQMAQPSLPQPSSRPQKRRSARPSAPSMPSMPCAPSAPPQAYAMRIPQPVAIPPPRPKAPEANVQVDAAGSGGLFTISVKETLTLPRKCGAMVPVVTSAIRAQRLLIFDPNVNSVMSAIRLLNNARHPLERGPLAIMEDAMYVGEAVLPPLKPGENVIVPYSRENNVLVTVSTRNISESEHRLTVQNLKGDPRNASILLHYWQVQETQYDAVNDTGKDHALFVVQHKPTQGRTMRPDSRQGEKEARRPGGLPSLSKPEKKPEKKEDPVTGPPQIQSRATANVMRLCYQLQSKSKYLVHEQVECSNTVSLVQLASQADMGDNQLETWEKKGLLKNRKELAKRIHDAYMLGLLQPLHNSPINGCDPDHPPKALENVLTKEVLGAFRTIRSLHATYQERYQAYSTVSSKLSHLQNDIQRVVGDLSTLARARGQSKPPSGGWSSILEWGVPKGDEQYETFSKQLVALREQEKELKEQVNKASQVMNDAQQEMNKASGVAQQQMDEIMRQFI